jgi:hypothetical protein
MTIPIEARKVLDKLSRIDPLAAAYVKERILENDINISNLKDRLGLISSIFTWSFTPQGYDYWVDIRDKYDNLPNVTKKGNSL